MFPILIKYPGFEEMLSEQNFKNLKFTHLLKIIMGCRFNLYVVNK